jgi:hypothetical protein
MSNSNGPSNNGSHQIGRGGVLAPRAVVKVRLAGEGWWTGLANG